MKTAPLWSFADVRPSNVDKKSKPDERAVRLVNYTDVYYHQVITTDLELMMATASDEHIDRFGVLPDDIIITKDSETPDDIGIPAQVGSADDDMVCAYHLTLLRPWRDRAFPRYIYWVLESSSTKDYWLTSSFGVTRYSIGSGVVSRLPVVNVDLDTQRAIADYLDRETGEIDAMIAKLDELAETLEVRKQALVRTAIADRARVYGRVPLQALVRIGSGDAIPAERISDEGEFPVYGGNGLRGFTDNFNQVPDRVLVGRQGALCGNVHVAVGPFWASEHALVMHPYVDDMDLRWLAYATRDLELGRLSTAAAQPGITASGVGRENIPSIGSDEQRRIADHLDEVTGKIDAMLAKVAELKSLLMERRAALITDVVTGRKAVA